MPATFGIVDLFAGPGGLGEGFASLEAGGQHLFHIGISVEKEASAHRTLRLSHSHVEIYTTPTCPDCATIKRWLTAQGIHYVDRDVTNPRIADEARRRTGLRIAPITLVDGKAIWGTAAEQLPRLRRLLAVDHAF